MRVLKFGGSSVGTPDAIKQVKDILEEYSRKHTIAVVVSAFQGVTDILQQTVEEAARGSDVHIKLRTELEERHINTIRELIRVQNQSKTLARFKMMMNELEDVLNGVTLVRELTGRTKDFVMGFGERFSAFIISEYLCDAGIDAEYLDARSLIKTDNQYGLARVLTDETNRRIQEYFSHRDKIQVITGFIASAMSGESTTLGRGGSDYTATIFGAALNADAVEIWTDIEGIMTADPRKVKRYFAIPHLSYEEAMELSHFGAKVISPPTMRPVMKAGIPILIKNTFKPEQKGTQISKKAVEGDSIIKGISSIDNVTLITVRGSGMIGVSGVASRIFGTLAKANVNIILITQASSEHTVCFAVMPDQAADAKKALEQEFRYELKDGIIDEVQLEEELSIVAIVSDEMRQIPGIAGRVFQSLGRNGINVVAIAQGSSERNISIVVDRKNDAKALNTLHDSFFLSKVKTVNLFLVGVGLIGGTLLQLIKRQAQKLYDDYLIDLKLAGISNSKKFLIREDGITMEAWEEELEEKGETADINRFIEEMNTLNLSNSIFIDCTASEEVSAAYDKVLESSVSIVTANKKANSGPLKNYEKLQALAFKNNVAYLYETNVGAGLPVVATLKEQMLTGDEILKIEGVLSGTLSYIFNNYDGSVPFSQVVRTAKEKGYTEPDPREDLNGQDVGRKLLILTREAGLKLEFENIEIENLVPEQAQKAPGVEEFFKELSRFDEEFKKRFDDARQQNKKLCYIARYSQGKATVQLDAIGPEHPFYNLSGSDNIISFHTQHYEDSPLVVKGPGAGAGVTASGIVADILRISSSPSFGNEF